MATEQPDEQNDTPIFGKIPQNLDLAVRGEVVRQKALNRGFNLQKFFKKAFRLILYFYENLSGPETAKLAEATYPIACLQTARNDLAKKGYNTTTLDLEIKNAEAFLQK